MLPVTITRKTAVPWLRFALREGGRQLRALISLRGKREARALRYVQTHAHRGSPASVLAALDAFARREQFLMNVGKEKGDVLRQTLMERPVRYALELGAYCGYSAVMTASKLAPQGAKLISIEKSPVWAGIARQVVDHAGLSAYVDIRVGTGADVIPTLDEGPFDLVFIDHLKSAYLTDLQALERAGKLADGCRIVADNVGIFQESLTDYLSYVRTSPHYTSHFHPTSMEYVDEIADGVEVSVYRRQLAN